MSAWTLMWSDEFNYTGAPLLSKWQPELGYVRNEEDQQYTARSANLRAANGSLVISALKEDYQGFGYTSASITTMNDKAFLYGRFEIRAKIPGGRGTWPAIWLLGRDLWPDGNWPDCGEIDIMEHVGHIPNTVWGSVHTKTYPKNQGSSVDIPNLSKDFHIYTCNWEPDHIALAVDGQQYFSFENDGTGSDAWPFHKPMYLLMNLAIGGSWGGEQGIDDTLFPHRYLIDYVQIYQKV